MLTQDQAAELCRKISMEMAGTPDAMPAGDVTEIVCRCDKIDCGDMVIIDRHIDVEDAFGDYHEIAEDTPLFRWLRELCSLALPEEECEIVLYRQE